MQIYGAPEGTRGCNRLFLFFLFHVPSGASYLYFSHSNFFIFSPFPGHQMFIFWPVENCTTWNLRYLMLRDAGWALRHWRSCLFFLFSFIPLLFSSSGPKDPMSLCHGVASVVRPSVLPSFRPSVHSFQNASSSSFLNRFWFWLFHKIGLGGGFKTSTQNCEIHYLW